MLEKIKKFIPLVIIVVLVIIGVIGYSVEESGSPVRVLFKTKGGPVIFTHKQHISDFEIECTKCHHETDEKSYDCRKCHKPGTDYESLCEDKAPHKQCIGANCVDCHEEEGVGGSGCKDCHR